MASVYINALLQVCLEVAAHAPPYVINSCNFVNNGLFEFSNSHDAPPEHTVFQEPPQEKVWYSKVGRPSRQSDVAETRDNSSEHFMKQQPYCFVPYEMASSPLLFPFPPTTTSYRALAIFQFKMCQSAPRHPVQLTVYQRQGLLLCSKE